METEGARLSTRLTREIFILNTDSYVTNSQEITMSRKKSETITTIIRQSHTFVNK